jgi:acetyltransferase-like isoleucine patch superfamily enzyme
MIYHLAQIYFMRIIETFITSKCGIRLVSKIQRELIHLKNVYLRGRLKSCGSSVGFQFPIHIDQPDQVEIGSDVSFAAYVHIWGNGGVKIGDRVMIASHTAITSITHDYLADEMSSTVISKSVTISDDVWIGSHAIIMPGITIGKGAVVGAGCIVTKDVLPYTIVVGIPNRVLKNRFNQEVVVF